MSRWEIDVRGQGTTAVHEPASGDQRALFIFAHGAGGNMSDRGMLAASRVLRGRGFGTVRFNFLYRENGSRRPDPMPLLMQTVAAVVERARTELAPRRLIIGGRSMGGRAASMLAAEGYGADGLLLLAYPLHPANRPERLRDAHLPSIRMPTLCFNGTRDALCMRELMERALLPVAAPWDMHWLTAADHSFHVLKSSGRTDADVLHEVGEVSERWASERLA